MADKVDLSPEAKSLEEFVIFHASPLSKIFNADSVLIPMWVAETDTGELIVMATPWGSEEEKAFSIIEVRKVFKDRNASRYAFISEAWTLQTQGRDLPDSIKLGGKVSSHPERREAIIVIAEDKHGNCIQYRRFILRSENGKATLSPPALDHLNAKDVSGNVSKMLPA